MSNPREREEEQRREALASLKSLGESDTFATSALARTAKRATDHFSARDAVGPDGSVDRIELWGRRIGRALEPRRLRRARRLSLFHVLRQVSRMGENDPLDWRGASAPTLAQFEVLAIEAFRRLPENFRVMCADLVIKIDDFATDEVLDHLGAQSEFDVLGLFQGVGLPFRSESAPVQMPNMIWLYRRPILDYWAEHDDTLGEIITHVLVHEIGHHFGMSDADMEAIERAADDAA